MSNSVRPWTVALKVPLFMGFPRQEYWRDLPFPSSGDICDPGIESVSPALAGIFFNTEPPGNPLAKHYPSINFRIDAVILLLLFFSLIYVVLFYSVHMRTGGQHLFKNRFIILMNWIKSTYICLDLFNIGVSLDIYSLTYSFKLYLLFYPYLVKVPF